MRFALGLAFQDFAMSGRFEFFMDPPWLLALLAGWVLLLSGEKIIHVEMMVDDPHVVGASGGGSKTRTIEDAIRDNAYVKQRPIGYRGDNYLVVDPFKVEDA